VSVRVDYEQARQVEMVIRAVTPTMGIRNYLIDGGSGSGKTTVADELQRRGLSSYSRRQELRATWTQVTPVAVTTAHMGCSEGQALLANQDEA